MGSSRTKLRRATAALAAAFAVFSGFAGDVRFDLRQDTVGRAALRGGHYYDNRVLGVANLSPELRLPVELVYDSAREKTGPFGFAWHSPQLESTAHWDKGGQFRV